MEITEQQEKEIVTEFHLLKAGDFLSTVSRTDFGYWRSGFDSGHAAAMHKRATMDAVYGYECGAGDVEFLKKELAAAKEREEKAVAWAEAVELCIGGGMTTADLKRRKEALAAYEASRKE